MRRASTVRCVELPTSYICDGQARALKTGSYSTSMKHKKEPKGDMMNSRNDPWWLRLHATWLLLLIAAVGWVGAPAGAQAQTISIVSGNNQTGTVGTPLANLLVVWA